MLPAISRRAFIWRMGRIMVSMTNSANAGFRYTRRVDRDRLMGINTESSAATTVALRGGSRHITLAEQHGDVHSPVLEAVPETHPVGLVE